MTAASHLAIKKPEASESKLIQLTSPILHIGSEVSRLNPFEYVQTSKRVYLPDREALAKALNQKGKLQEYIRRIEDREEITSLLQYAFGDDWQTEKFDNELIFPEIAVSHKWTENPVTDLRPMIRNGMGQLYIPGSSIKGAIRTAIAYHLLKHENKYQLPESASLSVIEIKLREKLGRGELANKQKQKKLDDELFMDSLFTDFALSYQGKSVKSKTGPNTDFMRAIKVTDSQPLLVFKKVTKQGKNVFFNLPIVAEVIVSSRFPDYKAKYRASIYAEMVRNVQTKFTLTLDTEMLQWFTHNEGMQIPFKNLDELLKICQEFAQEQWDAEHDYWEDIENNRSQDKDLNFSYIRELYEPTGCPYNLRVGWASGMLGTTVSLCLDDKLVAEIRDTCGIKAPGFEAPKSRRTVVAADGNIKYVPGWVKFKPC
ncbi:MAG: type III-A CRISPR-associated RAMP protein Csm5 [Microcoleus sp.]